MDRSLGNFVKRIYSGRSNNNRCSKVPPNKIVFTEWRIFWSRCGVLRAMSSFGWTRILSLWMVWPTLKNDRVHTTSWGNNFEFNRTHFNRQESTDIMSLIIFKLLLPMIWNHHWFSLMKEWKWIPLNVGNRDALPWLAATIGRHYLSHNLMQNSCKWHFPRYFKSQFGLKQDLILIICIFLMWLILERVVSNNSSSKSIYDVVVQFMHRFGE